MEGHESRLDCESRLHRKVGWHNGREDENASQEELVARAALILEPLPKRMGAECQQGGERKPVEAGRRVNRPGRGRIHCWRKQSRRAGRAAWQFPCRRVKGESCA